MNNGMQLSQIAIDKFKKIYLKEYGVNLADSEANSRGLSLLNLFKLIYKPIPKNEYERLIDKNEK